MSEIDPIRSLETLHKFGKIYAAAKANRVYLEEYRKTLKALLMKASGETSAVAQEREAYAHPDYQAHLKAIQAAVEAEESARWKLIAAQTAVDVWRSQNASNRTLDKAAA